jgi:hypothetical protein
LHAQPDMKAAEAQIIAEWSLALPERVLDNPAELF